MLSHQRPASRQHRSIKLEDLDEKYPSSMATVSQDSLRWVPVCDATWHKCKMCFADRHNLNHYAGHFDNQHNELKCDT